MGFVDVSQLAARWAPDPCATDFVARRCRSDLKLLCSESDIRQNSPRAMLEGPVYPGFYQLDSGNDRILKRRDAACRSGLKTLIGHGAVCQSSQLAIGLLDAGILAGRPLKADELSFLDILGRSVVESPPGVVELGQILGSPPISDPIRG